MYTIVVVPKKVTRRHCNTVLKALFNVFRFPFSNKRTCCIAALKEELNLKYPVGKPVEKRENDDHRRAELIGRIQSVVKEIMESIANDRFPVFHSIPRISWDNSFFDGSLKMKECKTKTINFRRKNNRADFTAIVFLLSKAHKLLMRDEISTRRQIFYENLKIFKSQTQVDKGMRDVCHLLKASSWELRISAASKGLVAGPAVLILSNGESVDCEKPGGISIPLNVSQIEKISSTATWVLVVEKEACFQRLVNTNATRGMGSFILITGKGFPDVNSRILVSKCWELLRIPILVLADADPHGFEIMCVYRFGSLSMSFYSGHLACPAVRWLGIHPGDVRPLLIDSKTLSHNDRRKVELLLKRHYVEGDKNLKAQLEILLEVNVKAEIEGVASISPTYLTTVYLNNKILCKEYL